LNKESRALWFLVGAIAIILLEVGGAAVAMGTYDPPPATADYGRNIGREVVVYIDEHVPGNKPVVKYSGCRPEGLAFRRKPPETTKAKNK
jgi:hypothetical protein